MKPEKNLENLCLLLPEPTSLQLESWQLNQATTHLTIQLTSIQPGGQCPLCGTSTRRIHSHYERTLADLPWADYTVTLQLRVRKLFCINPQCKRRIFSERIPTIAAPWARCTQRLVQQLTAVGLALGGAAGARLGEQLRCRVSRTTLLRLILRVPLPFPTTPQTLGVDDFSFRKRHSYGTILVDLDKSRPIALLQGREAEPLTEWLQQHPGIQKVSRDRSKVYKQGIARGTPGAIQVADRFHLLQNLAEALEQVFRTQGKELKAIETAHCLSAGTRSAGVRTVPISPPRSTSSMQHSTQQHRAQRLRLYQKTWTLHRQGWSAPAIAHQLGISSKTVLHYLHTATFPERQGRSDRGKSRVNPYKDYLLLHWNNGCHDTKQLFRDIQQQGYLGSYQTVARYTHRLRQAQGMAVRQRPVRLLSPVTDSRQPPLTARRATWLVLQRREKQTQNEECLKVSLKQHPKLSPAIVLAEDFAQLVRQRCSEQFDRWLKQAVQSNLEPFQRFARSLQEDYAAVKAGLTLPVSNGPVEGHINRLKMLKRQMYGRAGIELLSRRFLLAS